MKTGKGRVLVSLCLAAIFLWFLSVGVALAETEGDFVYTVAGGEVTITGYTGAGGDVVIPSELGGYPVVYIGGFAFENKSVTSVDIPDSVVSIGAGAFRDNLLMALTIPDSVELISNTAFLGNQLTSLVLGNSVVGIGSSAFYQNNLTSVTIPHSVDQIESFAFAENNLTSVLIHSCGIIREGAFKYNEISNLQLPNNVTQILDQAFSHNKLTAVIIPGSAAIIGDEAFSYNELDWVTIYNCGTLIYERAFANNQGNPEDLTINAKVGSTAQGYAAWNGHTFVVMEGECGNGGNNGTAGRTLGDFVWNDLDQNGIQDAGEPGMAGVTVNLWTTNAACEPVEVIVSTATDSNGYYSFTGLMMGNYRIQFVLPAGHVFTPQHVGLDQGLDSNPDPVTGVTGCITLESENNMTVDAGIYYQGDPVEGDDDTNGQLPQTGGYPYYSLGLLAIVGGALTLRRKQK